MENEELLKRLEFMDAERRKDRQTIATLLEQISALQDSLNEQKRNILHLGGDIKKSTVNLVRSEEYQEALSSQKVELARQITELEKRFTVLEKVVTDQHKDDHDYFSKRLLEIQNEVKPINELKKDIQSKLEDDVRLNQRIDDLAKPFPELRMKDEELLRTQKILEDNYRIEAKRVNDLVLEITALRKKIQEDRTANDSQKEYVRKLEGQINDLVNREQLRNQEQVAFIESQSRQTIDRQNIVKEIDEKVQQMEKLSSSVQAQLFELDAIKREVNKSQGEFDEMNQKLDRRINEITEMNRLSDERFRQEWIGFKADDQKRWTNFSLGQDEGSRENEREIIKLADRLSSLEDISQKLLDAVQVINEETEKRIKTLLAMSNEVLGSYERAMGKKA